MILTLSTIPAARGQIAPGRLHSVHAFLEGVENCSRCHGSRSAGVAEQCLECHTMIADRMDRREGLHGRNDHGNCEVCHVEHQGRDYDLIWWPQGRDNFDHDLTGYTLSGEHTKAGCRACHGESHIPEPSPLRAGKKDPAHTYFGLDTVCTVCHTDEHRGQLTGGCGACHTQSGWRPAPGFDHSRTRFALAERHRETTCEKCHEVVVDHRSTRDSAYTLFRLDDKSRCADCHQDVHQGKLGADCRTCHSPAGWSATESAQFDHDRTRYPLIGKHVTVACGKCHPSGKPHVGLAHEKCRDCHSDYHAGEFAHRTGGGECAECHTVAGFIPAMFTLEQHDKTKYPLRGAHQAVPCIACHPHAADRPKGRVTSFRYQSQSCTVCHADPHGKTADKAIAVLGCDNCHGTASWDTVSFDHGTTTFALTGRHQSVPCVRCHPRSRKSNPGQSLTFANAGKSCRDCHDDIHRGQFPAKASVQDARTPGTGCGRCHTPERWRADRFNHDTDAAYPLRGAHARVPCEGCHKAVTEGKDRFVRYSPLAHSCSDCHGEAHTGGEAKP